MRRVRLGTHDDKNLGAVLLEDDGTISARCRC